MQREGADMSADVDNSRDARFTELVKKLLTHSVLELDAGRWTCPSYGQRSWQRFYQLASMR